MRSNQTYKVLFNKETINSNNKNSVRAEQVMWFNSEAATLLVLEQIDRDLPKVACRIASNW